MVPWRVVVRRCCAACMCCALCVVWCVCVCVCVPRGICHGAVGTRGVLLCWVYACCGLVLYVAAWLCRWPVDWLEVVTTWWVGVLLTGCLVCGVLGVIVWLPAHVCLVVCLSGGVRGRPLRCVGVSVLCWTRLPCAACAWLFV